MPADIALMPIAQQMLIDLKDGGGAGSTLVERIGEFFPQARDFEWLTDPNSKTFLEVFFNEESSTGWLTGSEYNEFWGYVADYSDYLESDDAGEVAFEGRSGLASFLTPVLDQWEAAPQQEQEQPAALIDLASIGPVEGYPGWWQGYDGQVWKYTQSRDKPAGGSEGWVVSAKVDWIAAGAQASQPPARTIDPATIGPVEGYPGWWQGYDGQDWKYAESKEKPAGGVEGWVVSEQVDWDDARARYIYDTALTRHPALDPDAAWAAIWQAVSSTQADDETIIRDVVASQPPPVPEAPTPAPLPAPLVQDIRAVMIPLADELIQTLPPELAASQQARAIVAERLKSAAAGVFAAEGAGEKGDIAP